MNRALTSGWVAWCVTLPWTSACVGDIGDGDSVEDGAAMGAWPIDGTPRYAFDVSHWSGEITDAEVRCWWGKGVRHVIAGTQSARIMHQQLDMAIAGGMTVDAYVYLYWGSDMAQQVSDALAAVGGYPVGRLWLDVEEPPGSYGPVALDGFIEDALAACGAMPCGIYTARWWWNPATKGSNAFSNVPLWYAYYDDDPSLGTWSWQSFGGWLAPTAKQFDEVYVCGIDVDKNTMYVSAEPTTTPAALPPVAPGVPPAPKGLYPADDVQILGEQVRVLSLTVPGATQYAFEVQHHAAGQFKPYYVLSSSTNARRFNPSLDDRVYRFRARAKNAHGWGAWSDWARWEQGHATEWPSSQPPPGDPPPPPPPPGSPLNLAPPNGAVESGAVTMSCDAVSGAGQYAFEIEVLSANQWVPYYTYTVMAPSRTFYPSITATSYRWRVRANTTSGWGPSSTWSTFSYP